MFTIKRVTIGLFFLFTYSFLSSAIQINELMPTNANILYDEDDDTSDWIELYNNSDIPINLKGYRISDKNDFSKAWEFPDTTIAPKSTLIIFASEKNRTKSNNFMIYASGNGVVSFHKNDGFRYHYKKIIGDFEMTMRVNSLRYGGLWSNASLMLRDSLNKGSYFFATSTHEPSREVMAWLYRDTLNKSAKTVFSILEPEYSYIWLNIKREGKTIHGCIIDSENYCLDNFSIELPINDTAYAGIAVTNGFVDPLVRASVSDLYLNDTLVDFDSLLIEEIQCRNNGRSYKSKELHTNFKLSSEGETVYLWNANKYLVDSISYPELAPNLSYGNALNNKNNRRYFYPSTPDMDNDTGLIGIADKPIFSEKPGWYQNSIDVKILSNYNENDIYFTIDGTEPSDSTGIIYKGQSIIINSNTVLKAIGYKNNYYQSPVSVSTFFINDSADLPVFTISTEPALLFDTITGLFSPERIFNDKPITVYYEFFNNDKQAEYQSYAEMKLHGLEARKLNQKALRFYARKKFGNSNFEYPFFGKNHLKKYDKFILRNGGQDWRSSMIRDPLVAVMTKNNPNLLAMAYLPTITYINGKFWGLYNLRERIDEEFIAEQFNIPLSSIDFLENENELNFGSNRTYLQMIDSLSNKDMSLKESYLYADSVICIDNFIDYFITELFVTNYDWPSTNQRYWRSNAYDGKWRWILNDLDWSLDINKLARVHVDMLDSVISFLNEPKLCKFSKIYSSLIQNQIFKNKYINRCADLLNSDYHFEKIIPIIDSLANAIRSTIPRQILKNPESCVNWENNIINIKNFIKNKPDYLREHFVKHYGLTGTSYVKLTSNIPDKSSYKINTLTIDSLPWEGVYFQDIPINISVKSEQNFKFIGWDTPNLPDSNDITIMLPDTIEIRAIFANNDQMDSTIVINEIMYKPSDDNDSKDWIELYNPSSIPWNLNNWILKDDNYEHIFNFPTGTIINPFDYLVICESAKKFTSVYPDVKNYIGGLDFGFGADSDIIRIYNKDNELIDSVAYFSTAPWPINANGSGKSIELMNPFYDNNIGKNWRSSLDDLGSPGRINSIISDISPNSISNNIDFGIYPIPSDGNINIHCLINDNSYYSLSILNSQGIELERIVDSQISNNNIIDINYLNKNLQNGVYFCKLQVFGINPFVKIIPFIIMK